MTAEDLFLECLRFQNDATNGNKLMTAHCYWRLSQSIARH